MKRILLLVSITTITACSSGGNALYVAGVQCPITDKKVYDPFPVEVEKAKILSVSPSGWVDLEPGTYSYVGAEAVFSQALTHDPRDPNKDAKDLIIHVREAKPLGATKGFQDLACVRNITYAPRDISGKIRVISDVFVSDRKDVTFKTKELGFEVNPKTLVPIFSETLSKDFVTSSKALDSRISDYKIYQIDPADKTKFEIRGRTMQAGRQVQFSVQLIKH